MKKCVLGFLMILCVLSCSSLNVKTDYSQSADFKSYKSYHFNLDNLRINDIDKERIISELSKQLALKGLVESQNSDLLVAVKVSHKKIEQALVSPYVGLGFPFGLPLGLGFRFGGRNFSSHNQGAIEIEIFDNQKNKMIWKAEGLGILIDDVEVKKNEISKIIEKMIKKYPH